MIVFRLEPDGGFVAGDTETRRTSYAYPSSPNATLARKLPERIAGEMIASANRFAASCPNAQIEEYDARMWASLQSVM